MAYHEVANIRRISARDENNNIRTILVRKYAFLDGDPLEKRTITIEYPYGVRKPNAVVSLLSITDNENILSLFRHQDNPSIVYSPYVELTFRDLIRNKPYLYPDDEISKCYLMMQLISGVSWLHKHNIFHGYINPEDIYLENYYTVKVGGFYFSEILKDRNSRIPTGNRTLYYDPSPADENTLGLKYDIWCLGFVIYEFILRHDAFQYLRQNIDNNDWDAILPKEPLLQPFKPFFAYHHTRRPMIDDNIVKENLSSLNEKMEQNLNEIRNNCKIEKEINKLTKKIFRNGEIQCLKLRSFKKEIHDFERELCIFKDPNIRHQRFAAAYLGDFACSSEPLIWLFTEYAQHGSLKEKIKSLKRQNRRFQQEELEDFIRQLVEILTYMHNTNVIHRNLKTSNVLMFEKNGRKILKFSDFYSAKSNVGEQNVNYTAIFKSPYSAPELFDDNPIYGKPVDVWSVGCIIHEMDNIQARFYNGAVKPALLPDFKLMENPLARRLCERMIVLDSKERATVENLI